MSWHNVSHFSRQLGKFADDIESIRILEINSAQVSLFSIRTLAGILLNVVAF